MEILPTKFLFLLTTYTEVKFLHTEFCFHCKQYKATSIIFPWEMLTSHNFTWHAEG